MEQLHGDVRSSEGIWEKLSQIAVKGAAYDSRERQPHPKCLEGTRVVLLNHIYELSDNRDKGSRLIWLHGTAGVGKSAVAFTVAERMRGLTATGQATKEKRLAGSFFFSRRHTKRCTTAYFFATLAYQLAKNFPSIREEVIRAIREDPALLDSDTSLHDQMEALFLPPLRRLRFRLRDCPPLTFVVDALDECMSETEVADLIFLLGQALHDPDLPVIDILLTSRSEPHISEAMREESLCPLMCEIPVKISGEGVSTIISLDGADVDNDIYIFLDHSFTKLHNRFSTFPRPTTDELVRLASRAGRRFIVASTMVKFIDDGHNDPHDRLQLMLELTSELLPGAEVYKLYDSILSTCADPQRAYQHLSVVVALADPLPISQISVLLGPGQGRDVETALVQLRSVVEIPADSSLPVNIYHSSVRDYVLDPSNCNLPEVRHITPPHSLLAHSCCRLMTRNIPESQALLDALVELKNQSQAMQARDPRSLTDSLAFIVQPPEPLHILMVLLWLRGYCSSDSQSWLLTPDGRAWLQTLGGKDWLQTESGKTWLQTWRGAKWLEMQCGGQSLARVLEPRETSGSQLWQTLDGQEWTPGEEDWLPTKLQTKLQTQSGRRWLQTSSGRRWLQTPDGQGWLRTQSARDWLQTQSARDWLRTQSGGKWLQTQGGQDWLQTKLQTPSGREWLRNSAGQEWLQTPGGRDWLLTGSARDWLQTRSAHNWLQTQSGHGWLQTQSAREWLQTQSAQEWLQIQLQTQSTRGWLQTSGGQEWLQTQSARDWLQIQLQPRSARDWLQTSGGRDWLRTPGGRDWLQTQNGRDWLQTANGQAWQLTLAATVWVTMEEFSSTLGAISEYTIIPQLRLLPTFQVIEQFKSLPDFLMFPAVLALHSTAALPRGIFLRHYLLPDMKIFHVMQSFVNFSKKARQRSRATSDALKYACQNWAFHLSRVPNPWDATLNHVFDLFWNHHLLSWLERQWCLRGLQSCLDILSEGQKHAKLSLLHKQDVVPLHIAGSPGNPESLVAERRREDGIVLTLTRAKDRTSIVLLKCESPEVADQAVGCNVEPHKSPLVLSIPPPSSHFPLHVCNTHLFDLEQIAIPIAAQLDCFASSLLSNTLTGQPDALQNIVSRFNPATKSQIIVILRVFTSTSRNQSCPISSSHKLCHNLSPTFVDGRMSVFNLVTRTPFSALTLSTVHGDVRSSEGIWEKLSRIAVMGAAYDSRERQPHPKCLEGTRVVLLNHIYELSDNREQGSRLIWLHGTAGVGKSAVAFTVAERMRGLKVTEQTNKEKRLAGSFFFSRRHTKRCTTGYFFATLAYQLAKNFPSIREEVIRAIREDPALLDPDASLHDQMEALFLPPLRRLRLRLRDCPPLTFVVDALDECTSETEAADLISLLVQALHDPDLPVIDILLTSRSEAHISEAMHQESVRPLVCEIPVKISGEGVATIISLDGADVDKDIYIFLDHSFTKLHNRISTFPRPTTDELVRLASRAGRRFIVASTMMKFIDDGHNDPRDRLQLMLELTSELLPGTEVYKLYDSILSTCADPQRAYQHLSVVAALADPLPMSQISELLGPAVSPWQSITRPFVTMFQTAQTAASLKYNISHHLIPYSLALPAA
ncbi:hypothetical protein DFH29DRAFT_994575 [Suillus ampliporus]|nr:hypothetical protein DFH29DRAFT_994575 [Suillus ampliporus]